MKKFLTVVIILALILVGVFLWKGGHHALVMADMLCGWASQPSSQQQLTLSADGTDLTADLFWTDRDGSRIFGLEAQGFGIYLCDGIVYMDTGIAYTLPQFEPDQAQLRRLLLGAVLYGRVTKADNVYTASMQTPELDIRIRCTAADSVQALQVDAQFPLLGKLHHITGSMSIASGTPGSLPQPVTEAISRAGLSPPPPLTQVLEALVPALEGLDSLHAQVTLGVDCGILSLSEELTLTIAQGAAQLERNGEQLPLSIPGEISNLPVAALAIMRSARYTPQDQGARFSMELDSDTTARLCAALAPQIDELGLSFEGSSAELTIHADTLERLTITATGTIPFLITQIPLTFTAAFDFQ